MIGSADFFGCFNLPPWNFIAVSAIIAAEDQSNENVKPMGICTSTNRTL